MILAHAVLHAAEKDIKDHNDEQGMRNNFGVFSTSSDIVKEIRNSEESHRLRIFLQEKAKIFSKIEGGVESPREGNEEVQEKEGEEITKEEATMYRAVVARGNYLSQDRSDIQFAVKELCRKMSDPNRADIEK